MKRFYVAVALLCALPLASLPVLAQTQSPEDQKKAAAVRRAEFKKKAQTLVASKTDRAKYADFLKESNTGLIRLLPREKYITEAYADVVRLPAQETSTTVGGRARDGGAYYSFSRLTHAYGYGSDLALESGRFGVGFAGADYGFITDLGDVPLESVSLDTPEAKRLAAYARARQESDARLESRRFQTGAELDGVKVKSRVPMQPNSTYLLRAINYEQADVLVAFKVVEIDSEGTPLILWKRLKRYSTPQLARY